MRSSSAVPISVSSRGVPVITAASATATKNAHASPVSQSALMIRGMRLGPVDRVAVVGDDVDRVRVDDVAALATADRVPLVVAGVDGVVAVAAAHRVDAGP